MATKTAEAFTAFGVDCSNCDSEADVDVMVFDATSGEVVRDVYACAACEASIDVPAGYSVTTTSL